MSLTSTEPMTEEFLGTHGFSKNVSGGMEMRLSPNTVVMWHPEQGLFVNDWKVSASPTRTMTLHLLHGLLLGLRSTEAA